MSGGACAPAAIPASATLKNTSHGNRLRFIGCDPPEIKLRELHQTTFGQLPSIFLQCDGPGQFRFDHLAKILIFDHATEKVTVDEKTRSTGHFFSGVVKYEDLREM